MGWNTPSSKTTGTLITASIWNTDIVDNLVYLKGSINAQIQLWSLKSRTTNGSTPSSFETTTYKINFDTQDFADGATVLYAQRAFELPSDYNGGTITAKIIWACDSASTNSAVFGVAGRAFADGDNLDGGAFGTAQEVIDANTGNLYVNISAATAAITLAGTPAAGKTAVIQIYRDPTNGSDNLAETVKLLGVVLTYTRS